MFLAAVSALLTWDGVGRPLLGGRGSNTIDSHLSYRLLIDFPEEMGFFHLLFAIRTISKAFNCVLFQ